MLLNISAGLSLQLCLFHVSQGMLLVQKSMI
jgi:hypothetical protein